ncbi:dihydrodipicolinate reductase C-terminal domain-containing protein [Kitasatospora sp. NPDC092286]|uniref:dihydrodipicolinate reductase C-terminal domain-containing protein n=1 Tax=Kitasatospora sp. NPDC092286 TaxID=3364087 RepID=UPI00382E7C44
MPGETFRVALVGARGRLGTAVAEACRDAGHHVLPTGQGGELPTGGRPDVVVDAAPAAATERTVAQCRSAGLPLLSCASGLTPRHFDALRTLAAERPVLRAANLSLGHWLQRRAIAVLAEALAGHTDRPEAVVRERHTAAKKDSPSASALALAELWTARTGEPPTEVAALRSGLPVSDHTFQLTFEQQILTINHEIRSLAAAGAGALLGVRWLARADAGLWSMDDVYEAAARRSRHADQHR